MNSLLLEIATSTTYLISAAWLLYTAINLKASPKPPYLAWIACFAHGYILITPLVITHAFNFGFFNIASLISWLVSLLLLIAAINKPIEKLGIAIFPIAALMVIMTAIYPRTNYPAQTYSDPMLVHILSSIIAFSLLNIAALQAILLALQEKQLRNLQKRFSLRLPPLQTMESLLFQMISTGMVFLSISLVSGFLFIENIMAQHLAHKTILSIIAWFIFNGLLIGRFLYGWRGKLAVKWTIAGFILLLLAYFGSKLVLELILHR